MGVLSSVMELERHGHLFCFALQFRMQHEWSAHEVEEVVKVAVMVGSDKV